MSKCVKSVLNAVMMVVGTWLLMISAANALSVAVVDPVQALSETNEAKGLLSKFRKEAEPDAQQARKLQDELKGLLEKSQKDADIMSATQREKLEKQAEDAQMDYQFIRQKLQKKQQEGREQILDKLGPKFEQVMNQLVKEGKYDLILHRQAVFHSAEALDITAEVSKRINKMK